ncbi:MAG TPA: right-handed parallel beta-helix repeat-containing protein [Luteolibacter sp.]
MKISIFNILLLAAGIPANAVEFQVSASTGNDANPGTKEQPVASLERARDLARAAADHEDVVVILHDGVWRLRKTFELDARDSGKNGHKMIYAAAPGARPVITGSRPIGGWKESPTTPGIYQATAGPALFRQCHVDGAWAQRARSPYFKVIGSSEQSGTVTLHQDDWPKAFEKIAPKDLELAVCVHWRHLLVHCDSHAIGQDKQVTITLNAGEKQRSFKPAPPEKGDTCHLQNALELVDQPGEWYHSPASGQLSYKPLPGQDISKAQVEVPVLETLIAIRGTREQPVTNLEFRGITLTGTGWTYPSTHGIYATQFAQPYGIVTAPASTTQPPPIQKTGVPGALMASHTAGFAFRNGTIRLAGGNGLVLRDAQSPEIDNSRIEDIGCNAIEGAGAIVDAAIWNNEITRCGRDISNGGGILLRNPTRGAHIEHNHIYDLPYSGMQVGDQPGGEKDTGTRDNKIRYNHVHHCMQLHDDGGGIYTLGGQQRGTEIAFNFIHDIKRSAWANVWPVNGVYLDNHTQFVHTHDNVIRDCTVDAKEQNHSKDNTFERNVSSSESIEKKAGVLSGYHPRKK